MGQVKAKLLSVAGEDTSEFSDFVGYEGKLNLPGTGKPHNWFSANGDVLSLLPSRVENKDGKVIVRTKLGNTFTFRPIGQ